MHASSVYLLRQALKLDPPGTPVKVIDPYSFLGEIQPDLADALGVDVVGLLAPRTKFGYLRENWKPWTFFDGTPLLVPEASTPSQKRMAASCSTRKVTAPFRPAGSCPTAVITSMPLFASPPIDEAKLDPPDNLQEFVPITPPTWIISSRKLPASTTRPTGPSWLTLAARPSATSAWCPCRASSTRAASAT